MVQGSEIWIKAEDVRAGDVLDDRGRVVKRADIIADSFVRIETDDTLPPLFPGRKQLVKMRTVTHD